MNCKQNVKPTKKFDWVAFLLLGGFYSVYFYWFKQAVCPICGDRNFRSLYDGARLETHLLKQGLKRGLK